MIRISQYFHLYIVLLLPYAIDMYFVRKRNLVYLSLIFSLLVLSFVSGGYNDSYTFIWDDYIPRY